MHQVDRFALADGSYQQNLLQDAGRLDAFAGAIRGAVRTGDVAADLGAGSGVLAFLLVRAGASRVHAVEAHDAAFRHLEALVRLNGLASTVLPVRADAERWVPPEPVDVAVCELMETGLLHEPVVATVRQMHRAWPRLPRVLVPAGARLLVEGVALPDSFHGYRAPLPGFRARGSGEALTDAACYLDAGFLAAPPGPGVDARFSLVARAAGEVAALRLRTVTRLAPGVVFETGPGYCTPVVLPLPEPLRVEEGQVLEGALAYTFAFDKEPLRYALR